MQNLIFIKYFVDYKLQDTCACQSSSEIKINYGKVDENYFKRTEKTFSMSG